MLVAAVPPPKPGLFFFTIYICMRMKFFLPVFLFLLVSFLSNAEIIRVPGSESIRHALLKAKDGDVLIITGGLRNESEIVVDKSVWIVGENFPEINGNGAGNIFVIKSPDVLIRGFVLQNCGYSSIHEFAAIQIQNDSEVVISNNFLKNNFFGIYIANSRRCTITNNQISSNAEAEATSGNGIHLWKSVDCIIEGNQVHQHRDGIYFEFVKNSVITKNSSSGNLRYGLHFMFSDNNHYSHNRFFENGSGVAVMYSKNVVMRKNRFDHNWGDAAYGLLLKEISGSVIEQNIFGQNTTAIDMEGTSKCRMSENQFLENGWAFKLLGDCTDDTLTKNNFLKNTFDISTNSERNANFILANYWDHYAGYDLDRNGTGDVPYQPVSLYGKMIEQTPAMLMLMHSFFIDILDQTEKMIPTLVPLAYSDFSPCMKPIQIITGRHD